jgi:hypothetical protein
MALIQKKTPEQRALKAAAKEQEQRDAQGRREADQLKKLRKAFLASPAGQAQTAFDRDDQVFQYAIDVMSQQAIIVAMVGSKTTATTTDASEVLNSVCNEGWELVNGSFVFVEQGQQSRDKFVSGWAAAPQAHLHKPGIRPSAASREETPERQSGLLIRNERCSGPLSHARFGLVERRGWDLNPRTALRRSAVFKTAPFDRSGTPPGAKVPRVLLARLRGA